MLLSIDLSQAQYTGPEAIPLVGPGVVIHSVGIENLPASAVGQVSLVIGPPDSPSVPLYLLGRTYTVNGNTGGLWLKNPNGATFAAGSLLVLLVEVG